MTAPNERESPRAGARRRWWPSTLAGRLLAALALFTALTTAVVVGIVYLQGSGLIVADARQRLDADASGVLDRAEHGIADRARAVALLPALDAAQDLAVDDVDKRLSGALASVTESLGGGDVAFALDTLRRVVASSDPTLVGRAGSEVGLPDGGCPDGSADAQPKLIREDGHATRLILFADVAARADGPRLGCVVVSSDWEGLLRQSAAPVSWDAVVIHDPSGGRTGGGPDDAERTARLVGHASNTSGSGLPLRVDVTEPRASALAPVRAARSGALWLALAILLVTLPAAATVALGTTRALRALAHSARAVDGTVRPRLADPGAAAPQEVRVLHEALEGMLDRQEEARRALAEREVLASLGTMSAALAHEIRTPLAVMHGSAEMLGRDPDDTRRHELAELITRETDRLDRLVEALLAFARPRPPQRAEADLGEACARSARSLEELAARLGVGLELRLSPTPAWADAGQLQQIVLNLGANAIQASPRGRVVRVSTRPEGENGLLEVVDHGVGIAPADLERIWTPFVTTRHEGTGLGLPIVRRIVEAHGGTIEVTSVRDEGTTMRVRIPARPPREQ